MKSVVKKELKSKNSFSSKLKYLLFAYKFELLVSLFIIFFIAFFARSIFVHDNAVLNIAIYTSSKKQPNSIEIASTQESINKALDIKYSNHRDTSEVIAGSTTKISDEVKLQSMLKAKQVDILVLNDIGFNKLKTKPQNLQLIPKILTNHFSKKDLYIYKGKVLGIAANKLPILKKVATSSKDIFCLPANGENKKETNRFVIYLANNL